MSDTQRNNIYKFLFDALKCINEYPFFQMGDNSTLSYSTFGYNTSHLSKNKIQELDFKKITVNIDKKAILNNPRFLKQLYIQNVSSIEDILGKPFSFNNVSYDLLLSFYFNNEEENLDTKNNEFKYFNDFLDINQDPDTGFVEISVNEKFKSGEEFYINMSELKNEDHLAEIYYSTDTITLLPDSKHNAMIFRFKQDVDNFKFAFRVSKYTSTNLFDVINQRLKEKPRIYLNDKKISFLLENFETWNLEERKYKKVTLCNKEEMTLALKNNNDYKKENFLYLNSFSSKDQIMFNLLLEFTDVYSSTYHILCHLREYNIKKSTLDFSKECDWVYYRDIFKIVDNISTEFILNRSMFKIKTAAPSFLSKIKDLIENKKYPVESKDWISKSILDFLESNDLFLSADDILLYNRLSHLRNLVYDQTPGPEKRIHDYYNRLDNKYIPYIFLQLKNSILLNKNKNVVYKKIEYVKMLAQMLDNYFEKVIIEPFTLLIDYLNNPEKPHAYKYSDLFNKKSTTKKPQVNKNVRSKKSEIAVDKVKSTKTKTKNKPIYKNGYFIGFCVTGALITVIGGAVYTLM